MSASPISQPSQSAAAAMPAARLAPMPRSAAAVTTVSQPRSASADASQARSGRVTTRRRSPAAATASAAASASWRPSGRRAPSLSPPKRRLSPPASSTTQIMPFSGRRLPSGQDCRELLQVAQVVYRTEFVDVRQQGAHPGSAGLEAVIAQQGIEPDQAPREPVQAANLGFDAGAGVAIQAVAHQQYH